MDNRVLPREHTGNSKRPLPTTQEKTLHMDITMAESEEGLKSLLMNVKEESEKKWLKTQHSENEDHGILSHHFMANTWGNNGSNDRYYFLGLQNYCRW